MGQLGLGSRSIDWYLHVIFVETPWFLPNSVKSILKDVNIIETISILPSKNLPTFISFFDIFSSKDIIIIDFAWPISFVWPRIVVPRKTRDSWDWKKKIPPAESVRDGFVVGAPPWELWPGSFLGGWASRSFNWVELSFKRVSCVEGKRVSFNNSYIDWYDHWEGSDAHSRDLRTYHKGKEFVVKGKSSKNL